jgi:uncharacterized repeat protein (TIGR04076 family)
MDENHQVDESVWLAVQERLGLTDDQLEAMKKRPAWRKVMRSTVIHDLVRTNVVFEVVESHSCNIGHQVGDRFLFNGEGYMLAHEGPEKVCPFIMPVMTRMMWLIQERIYEGLDPRPTFYFGDCDDVGFDCGGLGKVRLETKIAYDGV